MYFKNRKEAGILLAEKLKKYSSKDCIVYAIPRGGVVVGDQIARRLKCPLEVVVTRKIHSSYDSEYAIGAVSESGELVCNQSELSDVDKDFLADETSRQILEIKRRKKLYIQNRAWLSAENKIAILTDDGVATGHTFIAAINELKKYKPRKIIAALPVVGRRLSENIKGMVDQLVVLYTPSEKDMKDAVSQYYEDFEQVDDDVVIKTLSKYHQRKKM